MKQQLKLKPTEWKMTGVSRNMRARYTLKFLLRRCTGKRTHFGNETKLHVYRTARVEYS